jgi:hypothetical protein
VLLLQSFFISNKLMFPLWAELLTPLLYAPPAFEGKSANETRNTISKVLHHINASLNEPRFVVNDWNRTLVEKNSLWNPLAEETTGGLMQEDCVNITTDDTHSLALDSIVNIYVDELGYADNQSFLDNFPMFGNHNLFIGDFQGTVDLIRLRKR